MFFVNQKQFSLSPSKWPPNYTPLPKVNPKLDQITSKEIPSYQKKLWRKTNKNGNSNQDSDKQTNVQKITKDNEAAFSVVWKFYGSI